MKAKHLNHGFYKMDEDKQFEILQELKEGKPSKSQIIEYVPATNVVEHKEEKVSVKAKQNIEDAINIAKTALTSIANIAEDSQHPRAYEVFSTLFSSVVQANKILIDTEKETKSSKEVDTPPIEGGNHMHFYGSPKDMLEAMKLQKEKNNES